MKPRETHKRSIGTLLAALGLVLFVTGCASAPTPTRSSRPGSRPILIIPGPARAISASAPNHQGLMWVLAGNRSAKTLHLIDLPKRSTTTVEPASSAAVAIASAQNGWLGVGTATATTGALQLWSEPGKALLSTVAVSAPVLAVAAAGSRFYVLNGTASAASVAIVDSATKRLVGSIPAPSGAVAIAPSPGGKSLWVLRSDGLLDQVILASGRVFVQFGTGAGGPARALAAAPDGSSLYVLKSRGAVSSVAIVQVATEAVTRVLPAPAGAVDLVLSPGGGTLYDLVGTPAVGNLQAFALGR